ncbi:hypothetical protein LDENG_00074920 [Lucifuga dentata]|nr:hypothetical protein LDENG_00074920 [Lucifuga dentata]
MSLTYLPLLFLLGSIITGMATTETTTHNISTTGKSKIEISTIRTTPMTGTPSTVTSMTSSSSQSTSTAPLNFSMTTTSPAASTSTPISGANLNTTSSQTGRLSTTSNSTVIPTGTITTTLSPSTTTTGVTNQTGVTTGMTHPPTPTSATISTMRPTDITSISTTIITTLSPVIVCPSISCPVESVCLNGTCQCLSGAFLVNGRCRKAQVFPGQLHLATLEFQPEMSNRSSPIFQTTAAKISATLSDALRNQPGYVRSDVVQLEEGSVLATVNNIFEDTNATQESVDQSIKQAIANSQDNPLLVNATFSATNLCEQKPFPCDLPTTTCMNTNGRAVCSCKDGYISNVYSNTSCKACPSGQRAEGDICQPCAFGYAGFNCNDSALLAVVVISCVLGGILLIFVLSLFIFCCWKSCSNRKSDNDNSPYSADDLGGPWPSHGVIPIPRASANLEAIPSIEMTEGSSTRVLVEKKQSNRSGFQLKEKGWKKSGSYDLNQEGMKTFKGKNPSRYSYLVQGHENPYFLPEEEKKN